MNLETYRRIMAGERLLFAPDSPALWRLSGPDALRYLNGQVTADVTKLRSGQSAYAAVCTAKGRMEGELFIARHGDDFFLDAPAVLHELLGLRLERYLIADDAQLEDITGSWTLTHVFGSEPPTVPEGGFTVPRPRYGVPGHDVWATEPHVLTGVETVEADVIETIRLEHGIPIWDAELTPTTLPPEAGPVMISALTYTKGCYVGQETISRLKSVGQVNRTLVFLRSASAEYPPRTTLLMTQDGREVGAVTSSGYSPHFSAGIALGYVQRTAAEKNLALQAGSLQLTLADPLPFTI